jgi:hypothetical protein
MSFYNVRVPMAKPSPALYYRRLLPRERFSLIGKALVRDDQAELDLLERYAPQLRVSIGHHYDLSLAFAKTAANYILTQLERATRLYALRPLPANVRRREMRLARSLAYEFLQYQQAWVELCRWLNVPPEFAFVDIPSIKALLEMVEKTARQLAHSHKQAQALAARDKAKQPITVAEILAAWQRDFKSPEAPAQPLQGRQLAQSNGCTGDDSVDSQEDESEVSAGQD